MLWSWGRSRKPSPKSPTRGQSSSRRATSRMVISARDIRSFGNIIWWNSWTHCLEWLIASFSAARQHDVAFGSWLRKNVSIQAESAENVHDGAHTSGPDRHQERLHANDIHHAGEVVSEHVERHLGGDPRQPLH